MSGKFLLFIIAALFVPQGVSAQRTDMDLPVTRKVMVINFDPVIETRESLRLSDLYSWNNADYLTTQYIKDVVAVSGGYVNYQIVAKQLVDEIPVKQDGFKYTDETYIDCWQNPATCHKPDPVNYLKILSDYDVCGKRERGEIDELWLWGAPYFGFYESVMAGPEAFNINAPPITASSCQKPLVIMGFNYERGNSEMLENLAHRVESVLSHVYREEPRFAPFPHNTIWGKFAMRDNVSPQNAGCGWIHYPPNAVSDYDWSNHTPVANTCEDFLNYPNLTGIKQKSGCEKWNCDGYQWKKYWLSHLPRYKGVLNGQQNNWWKYIIDYENANLPVSATKSLFVFDSLITSLTNFLQKIISNFFLLNKK